jgi:hypothetical protein
MQLKVLPNALTAILIVVFRVPLAEAHPLTPDNAFPCYLKEGYGKGGTVRGLEQVEQQITTKWRSSAFAKRRRSCAHLTNALSR